jgi:Rod binding domain-containing protein
VLAQLRKVCGQFEGLFWAQILRITHESSLRSDFLSGGLAADIFTDELYFALGERVGERGGLGIARLLYEQLAPLVVRQETASGTGERAAGQDKAQDEPRGGPGRAG